MFAPRWFLENIDRVSARPLAESWEVTTDSIAARVAVSLGADELRLLKARGRRTDESCRSRELRAGRPHVPGSLGPDRSRERDQPQSRPADD